MRTRANSAFAIVALVAWSGCRAFAPTITAHTIEGNPRLRGGEYLQDCFDPHVWARLEREPYLGYVILRAKIGLFGRLAEPQVRGSYPDGSFNDLALGQALLVRVDPTRPQDTKPEAEVYVVFYRKGRPAVLSLAWGVELDPRGPPRGFNCVFGLH